MTRGIKSGIITSDGIKEENVPDGVNKGNEKVDKNIIMSPVDHFVPDGVPNDGAGTPPTGEEEIEPKGQQTIDQGAGAIVKVDNEVVDRGNKKAATDLTNTELFGDQGVDKVADVKDAGKVDEGKEIVYSEGNLYWDGVGRLEVGYNLVSKAAAEKWLSLKKVRSATIEEVKDHYER